MANQFLDITGLSKFKQNMDTANEEKFVKNSELNDLIDNKIISVYTYKGSVNDISELPEEDNKVGDVYDVGNGMNYAWDGSKWDALGNPSVEAISDSAIDELFTIE